MKLANLITLFFLCGQFSGSAQICPYNLNIHFKPGVSEYWRIFNSSIVENNYTAPVDSLQSSLIKMFSLAEPFSEHIVTLAWTYDQKQDYKNAVKSYYRALSKGFLPYCKYTQVEFITENDSLIEYKSVRQCLDSLKKHIHCAIDIPFCDLAIALFEIDQMTRNAAYFKNSTTENNVHAIDSKAFVRFYDSLNLIRALEHIGKFGIPHQNQMTYEACDAFKIITHHLIQYTDWAESNRLYSLVKMAVEDGRLQNTFLRAAIDHMHWAYGGQYFGTYAEKNSEGKYEFKPPILSPESVDQPRAEWLLEPLEVQMRNSYGEGNYVLPKGYLYKK